MKPNTETSQAQLAYSEYCKDTFDLGNIPVSFKDWLDLELAYYEWEYLNG